MAGKYNISSSFSVFWMINLFHWLFYFYMPVLFVTTSLCSCLYINWSLRFQIDFGWPTFDLFGAIKMRWNVTKRWLGFIFPIASGLATHYDTGMRRRAAPLKLHFYATEEVVSWFGIKQMYVLNVDFIFPVQPLFCQRLPASKTTQTIHLNKVTTAFKVNIHLFIYTFTI